MGTTNIFGKISDYNKSYDKAKIERAYDFGVEKYRDTEGSMDYPLKVLELLLPLRPDEDTIITVLLHNLYFLGFLDDAKIKELFSQSVVNLLIGLKKLSELNYAENDKSSQVEILRRMFLTMAKDLRTILIWLAYGLCRMQNLEDYPEVETRVRIARETMSLYVPIASRLGIYRMKTRLEDLSFKYLEPDEYNNISLQVAKYGEVRKGAVDTIKNELESFLALKGVEAEVFGRVKSVYSIYHKLKRKNLTSVNDLYDFFAIRVILPGRGDRKKNEDVDHLYSVLGLIHSEWKPLSKRFRDYIAVPKPNGYRSLHTVVLGLAPKDMAQSVEIQIRDTGMHREAEYGVASHWLYKGSYSHNTKNLDTRIEWLRGLEKIHEFFGAEADVMKEVEINFFKDRIFVLTPRGEVKDLPSGSVPIDFAYAVHTEVGNKCVMAKVNGSIVPLNHELANGDVVEIIMKKEATPKLKWLSHVKSGFARHKIKAWFSGQNKESNVKEGRRFLNKQLERLGKPLLDQNYSILKNYLDRDLNLSQRERIIEEVGKGSQLAADIIRKVYPYKKNLVVEEDIPVAELRVTDDNPEKQIVIGGEEGLPIKMAACCGPNRGSKIVGYVTRGNRVTIHKTTCRLLDSLDRERIVFAEWKGAVSKNS